MLDDRDLLIANIASVMGAHYVRREFHRAKRARLRMQRRFIVLSTFLCAIFAMLVTSPSSRRYWIRFRSVHFAYGVRDGTLLRGREFAETFRMTKASFRKLFGIIAMHISKKNTTFRQAIPPELRIIAFLLHVCQGMTYRNVANQLGMAKSTVSLCVHQCTLAILQHMQHRYISLPGPERAKWNMERWRDRTGIPGIVAAVDGVHIVLSKPVSEALDYVNRYGDYSINVQGLVDFDRRFIDIEVGWPGSCGDARIFQNSHLGRMHRDYLQQLPTGGQLVTGTDAAGNPVLENIPAFILGDSGYANTDRFVTTYDEREYRQSRVVARLNKCLSAGRSRVEHAFGLLRARFALFSRPLLSASEDMPFTIQLIAALFVLHNFLIDSSDEWELEFNVPLTAGSVRPNDMNAAVDTEEGLIDAIVEGESTRDVLLRHIRHTASGE